MRKSFSEWSNVYLASKNESELWKFPILYSSDSKSLKRYQKILWMCSLGYKNLLNFAWHSMKLYNCHHANTHAWTFYLSFLSSEEILSCPESDSVSDSVLDEAELSESLELLADSELESVLVAVNPELWIIKKIFLSKWDTGRNILLKGESHLGQKPTLTNPFSQKSHFTNHIWANYCWAKLSWDKISVTWGNPFWL